MKPNPLFADDFDRPETATGPAMAEPVFSAADVTAEREAAWRDGHEAGLHAAECTDAAATHEAITSLAEQFATECGAAAERAEAAAEAMACLLIDSLAAAFPALCAHYGDEEVRSVVRAVLPALIREPIITVRAHPRTAQAVAEETERINPDLVTHLHIIETGTMLPGDVRITWHNGGVVRDAADLWRQVAAVLAPAGLLRTETPIMETTDGS